MWITNKISSTALHQRLVGRLDKSTTVV